MFDHVKHDTFKLTAFPVTPQNAKLYPWKILLTSIPMDADGKHLDSFCHRCVASSFKSLVIILRTLYIVFFILCISPICYYILYIFIMYLKMHLLPKDYVNKIIGGKWNKDSFKIFINNYVDIEVTIKR